MHIHMVTKTITIKKEAYDALKALQLENESFSDTILRLTEQFENLKDFWGKGTKGYQEYENEINEIDRRRQNFFEGR